MVGNLRVYGLSPDEARLFLRPIFNAVAISSPEFAFGLAIGKRRHKIKLRAAGTRVFPVAATCTAISETTPLQHIECIGAASVEGLTSSCSCRAIAAIIIFIFGKVDAVVIAVAVGIKGPSRLLGNC
jgi:hypothetical protein